MLLHVVACFWELFSCAKFETDQNISYVQTDAASPNIVGSTMMGVVASACTQFLELPYLMPQT